MKEIITGLRTIAVMGFIAAILAGLVGEYFIVVGASTLSTLTLVLTLVLDDNDSRDLPSPDRRTIVPNQRPFEAGRYVTSGPLFGRRGKV